MKKTAALVILLLLVPMAGSSSAQFDRLLKGLPSLPGGTTSGLSDAKIVSGLKEALQIGSENAVNLTGTTDGFLMNQAIKILMPEKLRTLERGLRAVGYGSHVDEFVVSMNRAAERAAPQARQIFLNAIGEMSFDDARKILGGGDTAATEYFKDKTTDRLTTAFGPPVSRAMDEVGVTRQYKELVGRAQQLPFLSLESLDLDRYVTGKALDGLFLVLGEQEQKIRTNPTARVTDLLKEVFAK